MVQKQKMNLKNRKKNKYDLILSRCVLHFLHKNDSYQIMQNIKNNIKCNGLVYIHVFSLEEPKFIRNSRSSDFETFDNNILNNKINDTYVSFSLKKKY